MRIIPMIAVSAMLAGAFAQQASAMEILQSVATSAAPDAAWAVIQDFDGISKWLPPAASSPADKGNAIGSVRTITLKAPGDPTIVEKLTAYDAAKRSYSYDIVQVDPKVLPVVQYHSTIAVVADGKGSKIVWRGKFEAPPGVEKAASAKAVHGTYKAGLDNIKKLAEK